MMSHGGFCSSALIEGNYFLTAAHCSKYQGERVEVSTFKVGRWGVGDFSNELSVYPAYSNLKNGYDLAISKGPPGLDIPSEELFRLPTSSELPEDLYIAGYGDSALLLNSSNPQFLRKTKVFKSRQQLNEISQATLDFPVEWNEVSGISNINRNIKSGEHYCFKALKNNEDIPFQGDSGGPLYSIDSQGQKTIHGVFSVFVFDEINNQYFFFCYEALFPKIDWIKAVMKGSSSTLNSLLEISITDEKVVLENKVVDGVKIKKTREVSAPLIHGGLGNAEDLKGLDAGGKILLLERGIIRFSDKLRNIAHYNPGVVGVIFYDNTDQELFTPSLGDELDVEKIVGDLDIRFIKKADAVKILQQLDTGKPVTGTLKIR